MNVDMNRATGVRAVFKRLGHVAERTGCAVLMIGHLNKSGCMSQYRGGSIDIYAAARSVLNVGRVPDDENLRAFVVNKSNIAMPGPSIAFGKDPETGFYWHGEHPITLSEMLSGGRSASSRSREAQEAAEAFLIEELTGKTVPATDMKMMAAELGISATTLQRAKSSAGVRTLKLANRWFWTILATGPTGENTDCSSGKDNVIRFPNSAKQD